jgi:hypothetical protein
MEVNEKADLSSFLTGSHYVVHAGLKLSILLLQPQSAGITDTNYQTQSKLILKTML